MELFQTSGKNVKAIRWHQNTPAIVAAIDQIPGAHMALKRRIDTPLFVYYKGRPTVEVKMGDYLIFIPDLDKFEAVPFQIFNTFYKRFQ